MRYAGYLLRSSSRTIYNEIIERYMPGTRTRDRVRQLRTWIDDLKDWTDMKTFYSLNKRLKMERNGSSWFAAFFVSKMVPNGNQDRDSSKPGILKDKSRVNKIMLKKQPYQLLKTNREFFSSFQGLNFHRLDD